MKLKLGIVGHGFVGSAVDYAFTTDDVKKFIVDPKIDTTIDDLIEWKPDVTFVCAPTPMSDDGNIDAAIVIDATLKLISHTNSLVVIKSTITPDVINQIYNSIHAENAHRITYNPEILTENSAKESFIFSPFNILGGVCLLYTSPSPRDLSTSRMPSSA